MRSARPEALSWNCTATFGEPVGNVISFRTWVPPPYFPSGLICQRMLSTIASERGYARNGYSGRSVIPQRANANPTTRAIIFVGGDCGSPCATWIAAQEPQAGKPAAGKTLSHEETLSWVTQHKAWRRARKTKPIWARAVAAEEVGKGFQTADRAIERARA